MSDRLSRSVEELLTRDTLTPMGHSLFVMDHIGLFADRLREGYPGKKGRPEVRKSYLAAVLGSKVSVSCVSRIELKVLPTKPRQ